MQDINVMTEKSINGKRSYSAVSIKYLLCIKSYKNTFLTFNLQTKIDIHSRGLPSSNVGFLKCHQNNL